MSQVRISSDGENLGVSLSYNTLNLGDNSSNFTFTITSEGQPVLVNGVEQAKVELTVVGGWELNDFLEAMRIIASHNLNNR